MKDTSSTISKTTISRCFSRHKSARLAPTEGGRTCKRNNGPDIPLGMLYMQRLSPWPTRAMMVALIMLENRGATDICVCKCDAHPAPTTTSATPDKMHRQNVLEDKITDNTSDFAAVLRNATLLRLYSATT